MKNYFCKEYVFQGNIFIILNDIISFYHEAKMFVCNDIFVRPSIAQVVRSTKPQRLTQQYFLRLLFHVLLCQNIMSALLV